MTPAWAIAVDVAEAAVLGRLRTCAGLEVCLDGAQAWVRGPAADDNFAARLRQVPGALRFQLLPDGQLIPFGRPVPIGSMPGGPWLPLARWLSPRLPQPARPDLRPPGKVAVTLVRSTEELPADMLLTNAAAWSAYGATASAARLAGWSFAWDDGSHDGGGRVLVRGRPLPPLPGTRLVDRGGIAVPAGWMWRPAVEPAVLRACLGLDEGDVALFHLDGAWQRVAAADWARATRSAIRRSDRENTHAG